MFYSSPMPDTDSHFDSTYILYCKHIDIDRYGAGLTVVAGAFLFFG